MVQAHTPENSETGIDRRKLLERMGAVGSVGVLAGCSFIGDGDQTTDGDGGDTGAGDSDTELGERVPTITFHYWTGASCTPVLEDAAPIIGKNLETLGLNVNVEPKELTRQISDAYGDNRTGHLAYWCTSPSISRADPNYLMIQIGDAKSGGPQASANATNWVNCDYQEHLENQMSAGSLEERKEEVHEAIAIASEECVDITLNPKLDYHVINTDNIEPSGFGRQGAAYTNIYALWQSEPIGKDRINASILPSGLQTANHTIANDLWSRAVWSRMVNAPLLNYDGDWELYNDLASSVSVEDNGRRFVAELKDATFHNGDQVTSSDVQFTYEHIRDNQDLFPYADFQDGMEINSVDDRTVEFTFPETNLSFYQTDLPIWGILHEETWVEAGAPENPESFQFDEIVGSGPFQVVNYDRGASLVTDPHNGHPDYDHDHGVVFQVHEGNSGRFSALQAGEIDIGAYMTSSQFQQLQENDQFESAVARAFTPDHLYPQCQYGPTKFTEFRKAVGGAVNRREINEIAFYGENDEILYSSPFISGEWRPSNDMLYQMTDDPSGDVEGMREMLSEAGWGWDDDDRLHYPADADLDPLWPSGENPSPDDFPCVE